jgi:hypothetical protein
MGDTTNGAEELVDISSYHMLSAGKNWRSYKPSLKLDKKLVACAPVGEAVKWFLATMYPSWEISHSQEDID